LGVTEAGDGEDGRVKSAAGIGTLLEDGIGDTIRVSLTEDPEFEIPVCRDLVKRYCPPAPQRGEQRATPSFIPPLRGRGATYDPFVYKRRNSFAVDNIGDKHVPVVIADLSKIQSITAKDLQSIGYTYNDESDKWTISDSAADYVFTGNQILPFALPGTLKVIVYPSTWEQVVVMQLKQELQVSLNIFLFFLTAVLLNLK
jgi:(E)-4-hydroxy-3-methylbut-2-enyl-diphosphate synthase